jgi:PAS domain S-box-containing protein
MKESFLRPGMDMMYRIDTAGNFLYVNQALASYFNSNVNDLIGKHYLSLIDVSYRDRVTSFYKLQLNEKQISTYLEFPLDEKGIWLGQTVELILDAQGEVIELIGILQDITHQSNTKDELDKSDFRLNSLIQNMDIAILMEDENRKVKFVNQRFCDLFKVRVKPEALIGTDCSKAAEDSKALFIDSEHFVERVETILLQRNKISNEQIFMVDERVLERDYLPIVKNDIYTGHIWYYRDVTMQHLGTMAIRESERRYREIIENIDLGLMEVDNDQNIIWANQPFLQSMGYSLNEIIGKDAKKCFIREDELPEKVDRINSINEERLKGESGVYELKLKNKLDEDVWMLISGTPIFNESHKVKGSLGIHHDITQIKKLQFTTEYRAKLQSILLDLSNEIIDLEDHNEDEIISQALSKIGSFVGADRSYIFNYDFVDESCSNTYEYCAEGISAEIENLQNIPMDALEDWLSFHIQGKVMIHENVQALSETNTIRQILEPQGIKSLITVPIISDKNLIGFIGFDSVKDYKVWNETEVELLTFLAQLLANHYSRKFFQQKLSDSATFGFSAEEALGKSLTELIIPHKYRKAHSEGMKHFLNTGEGPILNSRIELVGLSKSDNHFPIELSIIPIRLKGKYVFSAFLRDITLRKKAEDDMNQAVEQSNELARMKSRLMSMASHEFRTPLTTIKANAEMLEYWSNGLEKNLRNKADRYISRLLGEVDRLTSIMNDMLVIGRLESGKTRLKKRSNDIVYLSTEIVDKNFSNEKDGRKVDVKIIGSPYFVLIDESIYEHILNNLLSNAFKYSQNAKAPVLTISFKNTNRIRLSIQDYGLGIPEEEVESVFNAFYRSENTRQIKGTGMGLAIVKQFAGIHRIDIKVFSAINVGSEFVLEFDKD